MVVREFRGEYNIYNSEWLLIEDVCPINPQDIIFFITDDEF